MIGILDYFGNFYDHADATPERKEAAQEMLDKVNGLLEDYEGHGGELKVNPRTKTYVSGEQYGGFRPQSCPQGAPRSSHKEARAVDVYDPGGGLDIWISDAILTAHELYREAPIATSGWCHLTDKAPGSGKRTFQP